MLMIDTRMEPAIAKDMVQGRPDTLHSEFHLSYAMLLNLLLSEAADPESLLRASFRQFQVERSLPALTQRIAALEVGDSSREAPSARPLIPALRGQPCLTYLPPLWFPPRSSDRTLSHTF